jgi:hypothetical protein
MNLLGKWRVRYATVWQKVRVACKSIQAFEDRIWIVSVRNNGSDYGVLNNTFVVSEDGFSSPMSWMHSRGYSELMLSRINKMQRSQVETVFLENESHSLIRVK